MLCAGRVKVWSGTRGLRIMANFVYTKVICISR